MWLVAVFTVLVAVALLLPGRDGLRLWDKWSIRVFVFLLLVAGLAGAIARTADAAQAGEPPDYTVAEVKHVRFGGWFRVTVEIEAPSAQTHRDQVLAMMAAAVAQYRIDRPNVVSARLWNSYADDAAIQNRIVYGPHGCGWTGNDCTGAIWTDLSRGEIPPDLEDFGR